jgi:RNA ligase (TIGR02306 family)
MRKLASIQKIDKIQPIELADSICCVNVLGWQVVCKKDEVKLWDKVVYCEIDSLLPDIPLFEEIKKITSGTMRIRTIRMRGQVSQGICFPVSIVEHFGLLPEDMIIGQDVTTAMGITKYEDVLPDNLLGEAKGYMPSEIPKSDIYRVQTMQDVLDKYKGTLCYETEKLDGESITFYLKNNVFGVCSKEVDFIESDKCLHWRVAKEMDMENKLRKISDVMFGTDFSMQGEIIGEGIKKNKYKIKGQKVYFYNTFDIQKHRYFNYDEFVMVTNDLKLERVPVINDKLVLPNDINELVALSNGRSLIYDTKREGIVIVPLVEINDIIGRVMFKVISPEFLIKHGE